MANTKHQDDAPVLPPVEQLRKHTYEKVRPSRSECDSAWQDGRGTLRRVDGTVLDALRARKLISAREWTAGDRLRQDFHRSGLEPRVTATYEAVIPGGGADVPAWRMDAETRWRRAVMAVGHTVSGVLVAIIVEDIGPAEWAARWYGYGDRSAKASGITAVRLSLSALADHYGLEESNV